MIDPMLANSFIKRIAQYTEYNINIMDERGIIIASKIQHVSELSMKLQ